MEYNSIQYLRAVAALGVVAHHLAVQFPRFGSTLELPEFLSAGVDLFFIISGFIMWMTTRESDITPAQFYRKRIVRVVPLYWLVTSFLVLVAFAAPSVLQSGAFDLNHIIASYLFVPYPHPVVDAIYPILVPGWTLNYEMFFYAIFGAALFLPVTARLWAVGGLLILLSVFGAVTSPTNAALKFWTDSILIEFLFGMLIAALLSSGRLTLGRVPAWTLIIAGLVLVAIPGISTHGLSRTWFFGVPAAMILIGAVSLDAIGDIGRWRIPKLLGDASYSIYLSHGITLSAMSHVWQRLNLGGEPIAILAFCIAGMSAAIIVGIAVYFFVERPLTGAFMPRNRQVPKPA
ncbi:hypothetical protein ASG47_05375 [Devosia sp. Leaf420]|nr:hypothetical protein ASG47_05375 [Devosia sp. Leaf420]